MKKLTPESLSKFIKDYNCILISYEEDEFTFGSMIAEIEYDGIQYELDCDVETEQGGVIIFNLYYCNSLLVSGKSLEQVMRTFIYTSKNLWYTKTSEEVQQYLKK